MMALVSHLIKGLCMYAAYYQPSATSCESYTPVKYDSAPLYKTILCIITLCSKNI